jgi:Flp pilus assembly pilin Flp
MRSLVDKLLHAMMDEDGATSVEYAVLVLLFILVCLTAITAVGQALATGSAEPAGSMDTAIPLP